jgi:hypothetical protein
LNRLKTQQNWPKLNLASQKPVWTGWNKNKTGRNRTKPTSKHWNRPEAHRKTTKQARILQETPTLTQLPGFRRITQTRWKTPNPAETHWKTPLATEICWQSPTQENRKPAEGRYKQRYWPGQFRSESIQFGYGPGIFYFLLKKKKKNLLIGHGLDPSEGLD